MIEACKHNEAVDTIFGRISTHKVSDGPFNDRLTVITGENLWRRFARDMSTVVIWEDFNLFCVACYDAGVRT